MKRWLCILAVAFGSLLAGCGGTGPHPKLEQQADKASLEAFCDEYSRLDAELYASTEDELESYALLCE